MGLLHDVRFPGETDEYRNARDELLKAEIDLRRRIARTAALRRELPLGGEIQTDYRFVEWDAGVDAPRTVCLSELFEDGKDVLHLYSFNVRPRIAGPGFRGTLPQLHVDHRRDRRRAATHHAADQFRGRS